MQVLSDNNRRARSTRLFVVGYGALAFLTGFFLSTFDIVTHVKFFSHLNYIWFTRSYVISGAIGIILSYLISVQVKKISTQKISLLIFTLVFVFAGSYFALLEIYPKEITTIYGIVIFFPVNTILLLGMWRYGRMQLSSADSKKVFPVIKTAHFAGLIIGGGGFSAALFLVQFDTAVYLSVLVLLLSFPVLLITNRAGKKAGIADGRNSGFAPFRNKMFLFFSSRFTRYLIIFAILSALIGFCIHFAFINAAWAGFFTKGGMAKFYGLFIAAATIFIYGIDRYIVKRILYSYDSPYSILVLPAIILFSLAASVVGSFLLGNIQPHEHFTLLFLLLAMVKLAFLSSMQAVQMPSLRALFHSLDIRFRQIVYSRIEGGAVMIGLLISGIVILVLSYLELYSITIVLIFTAVLSLFWFWITIKLIKEYRKSQEMHLANMRFNRIRSNNEIGFLEKVRKVINSENEPKIIEALRLAELHQPIEYETDLARLLSHPSVNVRNYVLDCIEREKIDSTLSSLNETIEKVTGEEKERIREVINSITRVLTSAETEAAIKHKVYSGTVTERAGLPLAIVQSDIPEKEGLLTTLTKDFEPAVRKAAIRTLARYKTDKFSYSLLDYLHPGQFEPYAIDAIARSGDIALDYLEREAMTPGTDDLVLARIMRLYGKIGSQKSIKILLDKLGGLNDYLMLHSVQALVEHKFQANQSNKYRINSLIVNLVSEITYNLHIIQHLRNKTHYKLLHLAYEDEIRLNYTQLFRLLSLIYAPSIIESLERLFLKGSRAQISHAIELADQYFDDEIKPLLFALLEDIPPADRLKRLEFYFPQVKTTPKEIIRTTLTHDYNKLSQYPRVCAMLVIDNLKLKDFESELIFNATHPEQLLSETAIYVLKKNYTERFNELENTTFKNQSEIMQLPSIQELNFEYLLFNRYSELIKYGSFVKLSEFVALKLAKAARKVIVEKGDKLLIENLSRKYQLILFQNNVQTGNNTLLKVADMLLSLSLFTRLGINKIIMKKKTAVWLFEKSIVTELIYDNVDLANTILEGIDNFKSVEQ